MVVEARVAVAVVDVQQVVVCVQAGADVKVAHAGCELGGDVPVLALEDFVGGEQAVGHCVVRSWHGEAGERDCVGEEGHPCWLVREVRVEAKGGVEAVVAGCVDGAAG